MSELFFMDLQLFRELGAEAKASSAVLKPYIYFFTIAMISMISL